MTTPGKKTSTTKMTSTSFKSIATVAEILGDKYDEDMKTAFPDVEPPYGAPFGYLAMLQLRLPIKRTKLGIIIPDEAQDIERYRTQAALVRALGSQCFTDRTSGLPWVEGAWYAAGDFIRCPMYGGDRFDVAIPGAGGDAKVTFVLIKEADAIAPVVGNPLTVKTS